MQFDMNRAWREASAMVKANSQVLGVMAGVFFFLPSLAMAIFAPLPENMGEMGNEQQAFAVLAAYYTEALPWLLGTAIAQAVGVLALLALLTDRSRPTVGEALKSGLISLFPYIASQMLVGVICGILALLVAGLGAATGLVAIAVVLLPVVLVGAIYVMVKTSLVAPVIVIEGARNPINALQRSWKLTKGNSLRLFFFYFLILIAFLVVSIAFSAIIGIVAGLAISDAEILLLVNGIIGGIVGAVMVVFFAAIIASVHRQFAGPSAETISRTFE